MADNAGGYDWGFTSVCVFINSSNWTVPSYRSLCGSNQFVELIYMTYRCYVCAVNGNPHK
jgi:hypothetical protein